MGAGKAETPGGWTGIGRSVCDFAPYVNQRRRGTPDKPAAFVGKGLLDNIRGMTLKPRPCRTWTARVSPITRDIYLHH